MGDVRGWLTRAGVVRFRWTLDLGNDSHLSCDRFCSTRRQFLCPVHNFDDLASHASLKEAAASESQR